MEYKCDECKDTGFVGDQHSGAGGYNTEYMPCDCRAKLTEAKAKSSVDCKVMPTLKMYMGFWRAVGSSEGACLIFANNYKEAKKIAFGVLGGWSTDTEWIDVGVNLIRKSDYLYKEANQELLKNNIPHSIESPEGCNKCERWGYEIDAEGICSSCRENELE